MYLCARASWCLCCAVFFEIDIVQRRRSQYARILTPMNTCTLTLPLWAPSKDWVPADLEILEVRRLVVDGNIAYHLTYNAGKSRNNPRKGASTRIWTLVGSVPLDRPTIGLQVTLVVSQMCSICMVYSVIKVALQNRKPTVLFAWEHSSKVCSSEWSNGGLFSGRIMNKIQLCS
jgi:hypothetical protein